ncbi:MAG: hypothetical protein GY948_05660 [Alphaproteobacteria bacterium]|nr:hypothetical protein [Alphaproteobacteria bacterium]
MKIDVGSEGYVVAAEDLAPLLGLKPVDVPVLMRAGEITSLFELGEDDHAGSFRVTFWHKTQRVRLTCARDGTVLVRDRAVGRH